MTLIEIFIVKTERQKVTWINPRKVQNIRTKSKRKKLKVMNINTKSIKIKIHKNWLIFTIKIKF